MIVSDLVCVQSDDFSLADEYQRLSNINSRVGAVVTFCGLVRDFESSAGESDSTKAVNYLTLQHYPGMTENLLEDIVMQAKARWDLVAVTVIHRIGTLAPNDQIVFVGVASEHRKEAFDAAQFLMDYLKTKATFWKKLTAEGKEQWLDAKLSDTDAAAKWNKDSHD